MIIKKGKITKVHLKTIYSKKELFSFAFLLALICVSVRYCDLHDYKSYFTSYSTSYKMNIEIGYTILEKLFSQMSFPFYIFYGTIISISLFLLWRFFRNNSNNALLMCIVFTIYPYLNVVQQIRSFFAITVVLTGLKFLTSKNVKPIYFVVGVIVASLFHYTSVIYLVFIFILFVNYNAIKRTTIILFCLYGPLIFAIRGILPLLLSYNSYFSRKYIKYIYTGSVLSKTALVDYALFFLIVIGVTLASRTEFDTYSIKTQRLLKAAYIVFAMSLLRGIGNNSYRIALMAYPIVYVALDRAIAESNKKLSKNIYRTILILFPMVSVVLWWGPFNPDMFEIVKTEMWQVWNYYY